MRDILDKTDFEVLDISRDTLLSALDHGLSVRYGDNLRRRDDAVYLDSIVRGRAAQDGVRGYLGKGGIRLAPSDGGVGPDGDVDIFVLGKRSNFSVEVKSSLLPSNREGPDMDFLAGADIKMIARQDNIRADISRDIYIQTYFAMTTREREAMLREVYVPCGSSRDEIYEALRLDALINSCMFVGWITGHAEAAYLESLPPDKRQWEYGQRRFWRSPLGLAYRPAELIPYLRTL